MKIKTILLISILLGNACSEVFVPKKTTDKKIAGYFHKLLPTTVINSIYTTPYPDTYALIMGSNIVYGNINSSYLTAGHIFDVYTRNDITENLRKTTTPKIDIKGINVSDAVVSRPINKVNKHLIIFVDPDCPYCRQLEVQIEQQGISAKANIYYMMIPLSMHPNSKNHTTNILCAKNPLNVLKEYMLNNDTPKLELTSGCNIDAMLERIGSIARTLSINGTPVVITGDGRMMMGSDIAAIKEYIGE